MSTRSLNKVLLIGNLTRDPNLRYTPNGTAVCSFGLATNRSWTPTEGGEKQEKTEFHNIVAWGKLAEICEQILHKGDKAYVEGRLQTRDWKTEDGQDRRVTEIVIDNMMQLTARSGGSSYQSEDEYGADEGSKAPAASRSSAPADDVTDVEDVSDDIPF